MTNIIRFTTTGRSNPPITAADLMTPAQVARYFRVSRNTITKWARDGRLPYIQTALCRMYLRADIMALASDWQTS